MRTKKISETITHYTHVVGLPGFPGACFSFQCFCRFVFLLPISQIPARAGAATNSVPEGQSRFSKIRVKVDDDACGDASGNVGVLDWSGADRSTRFTALELLGEQAHSRISQVHSTSCYCTSLLVVQRATLARALSGESDDRHLERLVIF